MQLKRKRDTETAAIVIKVARISGYSRSQVEKVITNKRNNPQIMRAFMEIMEGEESLLQKVKDLVPFN